jgi:hypothetical protein
MMSKEDREAKAVVWLQRLREAEAAKEPLVAYARRHGLKPGEAYRWKKNLRGAGRWPAHSSRAAKSNPLKGPPKMSPRFARVRIVAEQRACSTPPLHLQLHLANGRRADLVLSDAGQLPGVLELLERSP